MYKIFFALIFFFHITEKCFSQTFVGESVAYDSVGYRFFTSDDGTSILQRAANGTISYFGTGLTASYGMEVMNGKLFAISGDHIYGYDLSTGLQVTDANLTSATFLNGLASNGSDICWATDFNTNKIYEINYSNLNTPIITTVVNATGCQPNGIVHDPANNRLVFTCWGANAAIKAVDLNTYFVSTLTTTSLSSIDGVDFDNYGNFYISTWSPERITKYNSTFTSTPITVTAPGLNNPADICYAKNIDTLAIPNSNIVTFIGLSPTAILDNDEKNYFRLVGNPVNKQSHFEFYLNKPNKVTLDVYTTDGKLIINLINEKLNEGRHLILLANVDLHSGNFIYRYQSEEHERAGQFIVE